MQCNCFTNLTNALLKQVSKFQFQICQVNPHSICINGDFAIHQQKQSCCGKNCHRFMFSRCQGPLRSLQSKFSLQLLKPILVVLSVNNFILMQVTASAGINVTLVDMNDDILKKSSANIKKSLERVAKKKFADNPQVCAVICRYSWCI